MDIPTELFSLSAVFFALFSLVAIRKAIKEKIRIFTIGAVLSVLATIWSILFVFEQVSFAALFWASAMIISIIALPELSRYQVERMRQVDAESSLRLRDFFSNTNDAWIKIAYRNGINSALALYILQTIFLGAILIYALDHLYDIPLRYMFIALTAGALQSAYILSQQIKQIN